MALGRKIMNWLFGCRHKELSRAFTSGNETYKVCLKCGARLGYSWQTMSLVDEAAERKTRDRHARQRSGIGSRGERRT